MLALYPYYAPQSRSLCYISSPLCSQYSSASQAIIVLAFAQARLALSWVDPRKYRHCASELTDPASPASFSSLETVVNVADARLPVVPSLCSAIFTLCVETAHAHHACAEKFTNYASIMLVAFEDQLCSKLCRHNIHTPRSHSSY